MNILKSLFGTDSSSLSTEDAKSRIDNNRSLFVLDVRQPEEYRAGHIPSSTLIPLNQLEQSLGKLPKDQEILCVCRSGSRSGAAARQLRSAGYSALNLRGGMIGWQGAGYPVRKGK